VDRTWIVAEDARGVKQFLALSASRWQSVDHS